ncbi:MAG: PfkB family carbohydrate kinase [Planctomycetia bacterium]|nr:PfkB family carbohydrate kinase [Planctomycetia bacterium]
MTFKTNYFSINIPEIITALEKYLQKEQQTRPRIVVFGDYCLDKYLYIDADLDEPSVETGLTAYQVREKRIFAGVGGTITANLCSLKANVDCIGVYGMDGEGFELLNILRKLTANVDGMFRSDDLFTNTYMKPMRQQNGVWTELNRLDIRNRKEVSTSLLEQIQKHLSKIISEVDAVIISDQFPPNNGSILTAEMKTFLISLAQQNQKVFFFCDSRERIEDYQQMVVKGNAGEILTAYRRLQQSEPVHSLSINQRTLISGTVFQTDDPNQRENELQKAGNWLSKRNKKPVLVTRGDQGAFLFEADSFVAIPAITVDPPIDICGAGDATNAGFVLGHCLGLKLPEAAFLAGIVSSITIRQIGVTGTATISEILSILKTLQ